MTKAAQLSPGGSPPLFSSRVVNRLLLIASVVLCLPVSMKCDSRKETLVENPLAETIGLDGLHWNQNSNFRSRNRIVSDTDDPETMKFNSPPREFTETSVPLDVFERPQYVFTIHGNTTRFNFNVEGPLFETPRLPVFKISVIIETMTCYSIDHLQEVPPNLIIQWVSDDNKMYNSRFCSSIDNTKNSFQTVVQVQDGMSNVSVFGVGNWKPGMNARLVASIYTDVADSCDNCPNGFFCCGLRGSSCPSAGQKTSRIVRPFPSFLGYRDDLAYRCIPSSKRDSLQCNGHPNCGFFCNADESREVCFRGGGDSIGRPSCFGGTCNMGDVALRIGILIVSCFLLPPLLLLLLCRFQVIRGGFDRCISFAVRNVNRRGLSRRGLGTSAAEEAPDFPPGYRETPEPPPYSVEEDPPPTYDECIKGGRHPPPSFADSAPIFTIQLTSPPRRRDGGGAHPPPPPPPPPPPCSRCSINANCFSGDSNYSSITSTCSQPPPPPNPPPAFQTNAAPSGGIINSAFDSTE